MAELKKNTKRQKDNASRDVVVGAGQVGSHIGQTLSNEGYDVVLVDEDESRIAEARELADLGTIVGNGTNPEIYIALGLNEKDLFLAVTSSDETNLVACLMAKEFGCQTKIARVRKKFYRNFENSNINDNFWRKAGVEVLFNQGEITTLEVLHLIENPGAIETISMYDERLQVIGYRVKPNSLLCGRRLVGLRDIPLFQNLIVTAVTTTKQDKAPVSKTPDSLLKVKIKKKKFEHREETITPQGDYRIQENDLLYICGKTQDFKGIGELFDPEILQGFKKIFILSDRNILAWQLAESLLEQYQRKSIYLIEPTKRGAYEASDTLNPKVKVILADIRNINALKQEGLDHTSIFIGAARIEQDNLVASLLIKEETHARTITLIQNSSYMHIVPYLDLDAVVSPKLLLADKVIKALQQHEYDVLSAKGLDTEIVEFVVEKSSKAAFENLGNLKFPKNAVLVAIFRGDEIIIPQGDSKLLPNDRAVVFAFRSAVKGVSYLFQEK